MKSKATLHVKLDPEEDKKLRELAEKQGKSKGQLVREAIRSCYETRFDLLPQSQQDAVAAYRGGFISLGKLAESMGLSDADMQTWLRDREWLQPAAVSPSDIEHAL